MSFGTMTIIGNLGRDAELRYLPNGNPVANFNVAVTNKGFGDREDKTLWYRCALFGKLSESLNQYLTKGKLVYVSGPLDLRTYDNKDGEKQFSLEITVRDIQLLGGKQDEDEEAAPAAPAPKKAAGRPKKAAAPAPAEEEDPFSFVSDSDEIPF